MRGLPVRGQANVLVRHAERASSQSRWPGSGVSKPDVGRDHSSLQCQRGLDHTRSTCGRREVADVALDGADGTMLRRWSFPPNAKCQRLHLDRVAERCGGAVRFHVGDLFGLTPASACAMAITSAWPRTLGAVKLALSLPSLLSAAPLIVA
jgi:hypothetical protein